MMNSLFSIFDPSSFMYLNWSSLILGYFLMTFLFHSIWTNSYLRSTMNMVKVFTSSIFKDQKLMLIFVSFIMMILYLNVVGLLPYIFTITGHVSYNFTLGFTIWLASIMWSLLYLSNNDNLAHLTPMGCPLILVPFMVMIELISSLIRPLTLALRLMANMMAGHLILCLMVLGAVNISLFVPKTMLILVHTFMMFFEAGVAVVQAYIFAFLIYMYLVTEE